MEGIAMNITDEFRYLASFKGKNIGVGERPWRTIEEIIESGFFYGCSEPARVLVERAKKEGIPARFLAFIDPHRSDDHHIEGHCYAELFLEGKWIKIDAMRGLVIKRYPLNYRLVTERTDWNSFKEFYDIHVVFLQKCRGNTS